MMDITEWCSDKEKFLAWCKKQNIYQVVEGELPPFARVLPLDRYKEFNRAYVSGQKFERDEAFKAGYVRVKPVSEVRSEKDSPQARH